MNDICIFSSDFQFFRMPASIDSMRNAVTAREQIFRAIMRRGGTGATCAELVEMQGFSYDIVQRRTAELHEQDRIMDSGRRRLNATYDKCAIVWVLAAYSRSPVSEAFYGKEEAIQPAI
jgi:predicted transcriptional regulator